MVSSRIIPLEDLKQRSIMFWLPPGGRDNGVWADTWAILAELETADAATVLTLLHANDIGGYAVARRGRNTDSQLYVDCEQYSRASDVLMLYLRTKNRPPAAAAMRTRVEPRTAVARRPVVRVVSLIIEVAAIAAFIALFLLLIYREGPRLFPSVHPAHHPANSSVAPAPQRQ